MVRIRKFLNNSAHMSKSGGPGIMLAVFAGNPGIDVVSLPEELEITFQGSIEVVNNHLQVSVGEYKASMSSLPKVTRQLMIYAKSYAWVGQALAFPTPLASQVLIWSLLYH
ncbi:hypothetical protein BDR26DRAFT_904131 [Obelidium mucronatum]|nr:hypothetical protein BDR26DRAFT_904131 [Obelidium mucronatum]